MVTGKEDLLRSLIEAFLMEKGTHEFYEMAATKAVSEDARNTFRELTGWEEKHMEYIQFLYLSIQDDRDLERFEAFKNKADAPVVEGGIPVADLEAKVEESVFLDDMGALILALEIEGKAYNLYRNLSQKAADQNARVVFKEMMDMELSHIDYLKKLRNNLAETS
ncbi:MAG: ferritin family protein [Nitrospiraceae bacterium]|nr:ferritin family protein [Nitrospiraceae bacterium]